MDTLVWRGLRDHLGCCSRAAPLAHTLGTYQSYVCLFLSEEGVTSPFRSASPIQGTYSSNE